MHQKVTTKGSDVATTSDKCNFPLSWPDAGDSPSSVKGVLIVHILCIVINVACPFHTAL